MVLFPGLRGLVFGLLVDHVSTSRLTRNRAPSFWSFRFGHQTLPARPLGTGYQQAGSPALPALSAVGSAPSPAQVGREKLVDVAVEHRIDVTGLLVGTKVLYELVRSRHVRPDLVPPRHVALRSGERGHLT